MQKNFVGGVVYAFAPYGRNMVETAFMLSCNKVTRQHECRLYN